MKEIIINEKAIMDYTDSLKLQEKSDATIEKYLRDVKRFATFLNGKPIIREKAIEYKELLLNSSYSKRSINSVIASLNSFFTFAGLSMYKLKSLRLQRQIYCPEEKELTRADYAKLINTANGEENKRLSLILQTICGTGIRVSELQFITVVKCSIGLILPTMLVLLYLQIVLLIPQSQFLWL